MALDRGVPLFAGEAFEAGLALGGVEQSAPVETVLRYRVKKRA